MGHVVTKKNGNSVIVSVKPRWANLIMEGQKKVELRRRFVGVLPPDAVAIIYSSSPVSSVIGTVQIESVLHGSLDDVWNKTRLYSCVDENSYHDYFRGLESAFAIFIRNPKEISPNIPLDLLRKKCVFTPPVSWRWLRQVEAELLGVS